MPSHNSISPDLERRIAALHRQGASSTEIAKVVGVHRATVSRAIRRLAADAPQTAKQVEESVVEGDTWQVSLPQTRIHTLEQLVEHCKVDLQVWEVERFVCNKWEVGAKDKDGKINVEPLFQVKAFLRRNRQVDFAKRQVEDLRKAAARFSPKFPIIRAKNAGKSAVLAEYSAADHHIGGLIWSAETGHADWDSKLALESYREAMSTLIRRTRDARPEKALLVLGHDFLNSDNQAGTTTRGTPQSNDSRHQKMFSVAKQASLWVVDALLGEFGAVDVMITAGNHDSLSAWFLGDTLASWYRRCKAVTVDNRPLPRKYVRWGTCLLGFSHGHGGKREDYGQVMASEVPELWGSTRWREMHVGHFHHRELMEQKGAAVRVLPSLRPPCAWSSEQGYVGSVRAAEAYLWHREQGLVGTAVHSIL